MSKTLAIIGARLNSSRLPGKHLLKLNGIPMIGQLLKRLKKCDAIDSIALATTSDQFNQPLIEWASNNDVNCTPYSGDVNDLMSRLDEIIQDELPDFIVYICGDCPLIDPTFIDHAIQSLRLSNKDTIVLDSNVISLHEGMAFYSLAGWNKLNHASNNPMAREHVGYADRQHEILSKEYIFDSNDFSKVKHRISVDTRSDYDFMREIYQRWYAENPSDSIVDLLWVQDQLLLDQSLRMINAHVNQKKPDCEYSNVSIYCHISSKIGIGHLKRCEIIANSLQEHLSVGAHIHILSEEQHDITMINKCTWYQSESALYQAIENDSSRLVILDFNPDRISTDKLYESCKKLKKTRINNIIGIDRMVDLVDILDWVFVPSFNDKFDNEKISCGWENYLFESFPKKDKKEQILILTGGSDALGYGQTLPSLLTHITWPIIWVQGPLATAPCIPDNSTISVVESPKNLKELIAESTIILSCYGISLFESIYNSASVILLPVKHLCDADELTKLASFSCCKISSSEEQTVLFLHNLVQSPEEREQLINNASKVFANHSGINSFITGIKKFL